MIALGWFLMLTLSRVLMLRANDRDVLPKFQSRDALTICLKKENRVGGCDTIVLDTGGCTG